MEVIGLYDIDLWHYPQKYPNLELMKTYNYYYKQNIKVVMMNPSTEVGRFSKIYYFQDNKKVNIPLSLKLSGPNVNLFGYGFYGKDELLPEPIQATPPSFLPYDIYCDKLAIKKTYETVRRRSVIRAATYDLTGLTDSKHVYVVDRSPAQCENLIKILKSYPEKKFTFFHGLRMKSMEMIEIFRPYLPQLCNRLVVDFNYSPEFYEAHCGDLSHYYFNISIRPFESELDYIERMIKVVLILRKREIEVALPIRNNDPPLLKAICEWNNEKKQQSFAEYSKGKEYENFLYSTPINIRSLLKKKPEKVNSSSLDFWHER